MRTNRFLVLLKIKNGKGGNEQKKNWSTKHTHTQTRKKKKENHQTKYDDWSQQKSHYTYKTYIKVTVTMIIFFCLCLKESIEAIKRNACHRSVTFALILNVPYLPKTNFYRIHFMSCNYSNAIEMNICLKQRAWYIWARTEY